MWFMKTEDTLLSNVAKSQTLNEWHKKSLTNGIYDNIANIIKFLIRYSTIHKCHSILCFERKFI